MRGGSASLNYSTCRFCGGPLGRNQALEHWDVARRIAFDAATARARDGGARDQERRALEGALARLEEAWKEAEEVAASADNLLVPRNVTERLAATRARVFAR